MDFNTNCLRKLTGRYMLWLFITILLCAALYYFRRPGVNISVELYSKVIKFVSYGWIAAGILHAVYRLDSKEKNAGKANWWYLGVFWLTVLVAVSLLGMGIYHAAHEEQSSSLRIYIENILLLLPVMGMACANYRLVNIHQDNVELSREHKRFLYLVDLPCLVAAFTLLGMVGVSRFFGLINENEMSVSLSGAMAFLVFITYVSDEMLQHFKEPSPS